MSRGNGGSAHVIGLGLCVFAAYMGLQHKAHAAEDSGPASMTCLTRTQQSNARTIITTGSDMGIPRRGQEVAIATALQESGLYNLKGGMDGDNAGIFQQRPGWGSRAQRMDPGSAATAFYQHLRRVPSWQSKSVNDAAQAVQQSGVPGAYGKWAQLAHKTVTNPAATACQPKRGK